MANDIARYTTRLRDEEALKPWNFNECFKRIRVLYIVLPWLNTADLIGISRGRINKNDTEQNSKQYYFV